MRLFAPIALLTALPFTGQGQSVETPGKSQFGFIANAGQIHDQDGNLNSTVKFILVRPGLNVQVRNDGFSYDTYTIESQGRWNPRLPNASTRPSRRVRYHRIDITFPGANPAVEIVTGSRAADLVRYIGEGTISTSHYESVLYRNLYDGIDLKLYTSDHGSFEYDLVVHPGADAGDIRMSFAGQLNLSRISGRTLELKLNHGELREEIPASYIAATKQNVNVGFRITSLNEVGFDVPAYDHSQTLVIDPSPNLLWATYYGGSNFDSGESVSSDASDNIYYAGYTESTGSGVIATSGAHQTTFQGVYDAFVAKFNAAGVRQFGTYFGGTDEDIFLGVLADGSGNIYAAGYSSSTGLATAGTAQTTNAGGSDVIILKLNSSGTRLWSTYYGGTGTDYSFDITLDAANNPVLSGRTDTQGLTMTAGWQTGYGGGTNDGLIVAFNAASGTKLVSSYVGGPGNDGGLKIICDGSSNVHFVGWTNSTSGIALSGHQSSLGGGYDAFVVKLGNTGTKLWGTYYGGTLDDEGYGVGIDASGNVYITGYTTSSSGISTAGVHQTTYNAGEDGFVAKFNSSGVRQWGTYYGGSGDDVLWSIVGNTSYAFVVGKTTSASGISSAGSYQSAFGGGLSDAVLARFNSSNGTLTWGSYYGGDDDDIGWYNTVDLSGNFIISGYTYSTSGISTVGSHQPAHSGGADGFLAKFENGTASAPVPTITSFTPTSGSAGALITINGTGFSTTASQNVVYFGATKATPQTATATQLSVQVPSGSSYSPITVTVNGLTAYSKLSFMPTYTGSGVINASTFSPKFDLTGGGTETNCTAFADIDLDGKPDLLLTATGILSIYRNNSSSGTLSASSFASKVDFAIPAGQNHHITVADFDGDGKPDVAVAANSGVGVFRNTSVPGTINSSTFATRVDLTASPDPRFGTAADFDGDGKTDLAVSNVIAGTVVVFKNTNTVGSITSAGFGTTLVLTAGSVPLGVVAGDIDGDNKTDIAVVNQNGGVSVFHNTSTTPTIAFAPKFDFGTVTTPQGIAIGDINSDGKLDLVTSSASGFVSIYRNTATSGAINAGSFAAKVDMTAAANSFAVALADIDGDNQPDIVSDSNTGFVQVYKNNGGGTFLAKVDFPCGTAPSISVSVADLDGDGKPDVAVPNNTPNLIAVLQNATSTGGVTEPTASPTGFLATPSSTSISISFTAATGSPTGYIALRGTAVPNTDPADGTFYSVDQVYGNAVVVHVGSGVTFNDTGLTSATPYNYKIYSYNQGVGINYRQTSPLTGNSTTTASTLATEPTAAPTSFAVSNQTNSSLTITFTAATGSPAGYLTIRGPAGGAAPNTGPADGTAYSAGTTLGNGTVANSGSSTSFDDTGLAANTTYTYRVYSFNGSGTTTNYLQTNNLGGTGTTNNTAPTVPSAFGNVTTSNINDLYAVRFVTATNAFAGGDGGTMLRTTNGGTSWTTVTVPTTDAIWGIYFSSTSNGIAVGSNGLVLRTNDGGTSWTLVTNPATDALYAIFIVPGTQIGYAAGDNGFVMKTTDGGATWVEQPGGAVFTPSGSYHNTIYFKSATEGFIGGPDGVIRTTDGGTTWTSFSDDPILWYSFPTAAIGYGVGSNGVIMKTTDGGTNWTSQASGVTSNLWSAHFVDASIGFAVGSEGVILKTTNGGTTWTAALEGATGVVYSIHFGSASNGVVVGESGYIAKAEAEPTPFTVTLAAAPTSINYGTSQGVAMNVSDASRVSSVRFKSIGIVNDAKGMAPASIPVSSSGGSFQTSVTSTTDANSEKVGFKYWYVYEYDAKFGRKDSTVYTYMYIKYTDGNTLKLTNLRAGSTQSDYQLISAPIQTDAGVSTIFGTPDKSKWRLYSSTPSGTNSTTYNEITGGSLAVGKGYWYITTVGGTVDLGSGTAVNAKATDPFKLILSNGYNLIGSPYNFNVGWTPGNSVRELRTFFNGSWSSSTTFEPFKGYYVDADVAGTYDVPLTGNFDGGRARELRIDQDESSWELELVIAQGGLRNEMGKIGMHPDASLGYDILDDRVFPMPGFFDLASLNVNRPEAGMALEQDYIPTTNNAVWDFTLKGREESSPVVLSWKPESIAAIGRNLYLFDEKAVALIDMNIIASHHTRTNVPLRIITGDPQFVKSHVRFGESRIGALYPNPATNGFFVPVAMTRSGEVQIRIFDLKGVEIASQVHFAGEGIHNISVSGLPEGLSGLYLVTTETGGAGRKVQKLAVK